MTVKKPGVKLTTLIAIRLPELLPHSAKVFVANHARCSSFFCMYVSYVPVSVTSCHELARYVMSMVWLKISFRIGSENALQLLQWQLHMEMVVVPGKVFLFTLKLLLCLCCMMLVIKLTTELYTVSQKNVPPLPCYNIDKREWILIFFGRNATNKVSSQKTFYCATPNNLCFCTTWQNRNTKIAFFTRCISALPEFNQSLLDFFSLYHSRLILTLLYHSLNLVINAFSLGLLWGMVQEKGS